MPSFKKPPAAGKSPFRDSMPKEKFPKQGANAGKEKFPKGLKEKFPKEGSKAEEAMDKRQMKKGC